jgi:hypothetical protein
LPLSIIQATGGPREGWDVNGNALLNLSRNVGNDNMVCYYELNEPLFLLKLRSI